MEFVARVAEASGIISERSFTSESEAVLRQELEKGGLHVFKVRARRASLLAGLGGVRAVDVQEFITFNQELVALLHAGLPILNSLGLLAERRRDLRFRDILMDIQGKVKAGSSLSDAFASHGGAFPSVYAPSVMAGERSGGLEEVLRRYIGYAQIILGVKRKVTAALVYPAVLIALSMGLVAILVTYVIPKFSGFYADFEAELPLVTSLLIAGSDLARRYLWLLVALLVAGIAAFRLAAALPGARAARDHLLLQLPVGGEVFRKYSISQFARTLATLLSGGLPLVPSVQIASGAVANAHIAKRVSRVVDGVREGASLTDSLDKTGLWSDTTLQMVRVGESAGALAEMLQNVADFYDAEVDRKVQTFVTLLEPALLVMMGLVIAGMLLAMYYPLFTLIQVVR